MTTRPPAPRKQTPSSGLTRAWRWRAGGVLAVAFVAALGWWFTAIRVPVDGQERRRDTVVEFLTADAAGSFAPVVPGVVPRFPRDHGAHEGFRQEWWYFTGNLATPTGRRFGFQLTFFRFAHGAMEAYRGSAWRNEQSYMAHFAISDVSGRRQFAAQDYARGTLGLAGAAAVPFRVWTNGWSAVAPAGNAGAFAARLRASTDEAAIDLLLHTEQPPLLQGDAGYSIKDAAGRTASYYYSLPRLKTRGRIVVEGKAFDVSGLAWMDREWSTEALSKAQTGWDWFALRIDDGSVLMAFEVRGKRDDPYVYAVRVDPNGRIRRFGPGEVALEPTRWWTNRESTARYPLSWRVVVAPAGIDIEVSAAFDAQELDLDFRYWEGVVDVIGSVDNRAVSGEGYMELTGY